MKHQTKLQPLSTRALPKKGQRKVRTDQWNEGLKAVESSVGSAPNTTWRVIELKSGAYSDFPTTLVDWYPPIVIEPRQIGMDVRNSVAGRSFAITRGRDFFFDRGTVTVRPSIFSSVQTRPVYTTHCAPVPLPHLRAATRRTPGQLMLLHRRRFFIWTEMERAGRGTSELRWCLIYQLER